MEEIKVTLTEDDYEELASQVEEGEGVATIDKDGNEINVSYCYEEDAYQEDDYYNGTGAWVVTGCNLSVEGVECYDYDGNMIDVELDELKLYSIVREQRIY